MSESIKKTQRQEKRAIKKYILHQKVNPKLLGVAIYNQELFTPYNAYLSCKLIFKKDIQSFAELEYIAQKISDTWNAKKNDLLIKKINIFTAIEHIIVTFTIGFYEEEHVKQLRTLKQFAIDLIESGNNVIQQEQEIADQKREELNEILATCTQLSKKMEGLESRLIKNESIVLGSGEVLKNEITKVSQTIKEQMDQVDYKVKNSQENLQTKKQANAIKLKKEPIQVVDSINKTTNEKKEKNEDPKKVRKYFFDKSKRLSLTLTIQDWEATRQSLKQARVQKIAIKEALPEPTSQLELEIYACFKENENASKKRMIPKKEFFVLKAKVEFIDYLWMLLELEGKKEIIIANKISCRQLVEELSSFTEKIEEVAGGPTIFNYWFYCPEELLIKLKGYAALKNFLSNFLKLSNNTVLVNEV
ncbi:hypothetical protein [Candidatus Enterococcus mansonii]|uniref:Uncharacterized protein n=1 Tax=Candidatus Enterococcus mansonii TaxID=1834181 RepID=A0A242BXZ0_9ENTE|nr:hypothetical protein [Enterococcus sp. 4G2_DIV0659]OTO02767.1 hypothetical protein A5880_003180 [Enterococcus sp. 4G2_DIV0659]